jgi:hypothetical protein
MAESTSHHLAPKGDIAKLIKSSGCRHIQEAIQVIEGNGYSLGDLDQDTIDTVLGTMASAQSVGGEAAPRNEAE